MIFRMRVDELEAGVWVKWSCIGGPEEWLGTHVLFGLVMLEGGATSIAFTHGGWRAETGMYPSATATWGHIMPHLKGKVRCRAPISSANKVAHPHRSGHLSFQGRACS